MVILTINPGAPWDGHARVLPRAVATMTRLEKRETIRRAIGVARLDQVDIIGDQLMVKGRAYATISTSATLPKKIFGYVNQTERARLDALVASEKVG